VPNQHRIPTNLTPTGDIIVPLVIPHDPQWTGLILGVLITLEETEYYQKDPDFDDENAKVVAAQWRDRTINPLIEAIASGLGVITMRKFTLQNVDIVANQTQLNNTAGTVVNSNFSHTFDHQNAIIRCYGIALSGSLATTISTAQVDLGGEATDDRADAISEGTAARELVAVATFSGLPTGVSKTVSLVLSAAGGQSTINANSRLLFEIEEWN
jgi:PPE-repeat protein